MDPLHSAIRGARAPRRCLGHAPCTLPLMIQVGATWHARTDGGIAPGVAPARRVGGRSASPASPASQSKRVRCPAAKRAASKRGLERGGSIALPLRTSSPLAAVGLVAQVVLGRVARRSLLVLQVSVVCCTAQGIATPTASESAAQTTDHDRPCKQSLSGLGSALLAREHPFAYLRNDGRRARRDFTRGARRRTDANFAQRLRGSARTSVPRSGAVGPLSRGRVRRARHARSAAPDVEAAYTPECFVADFARVVAQATRRARQPDAHGRRGCRANRSSVPCVADGYEAREPHHESGA